MAFGSFVVDRRTGELWRNGTPIPLQEQPFRVLALLLERPGHLVTREDIRKRVWPASVFTDFEHGLNKAVNKLRHALGDVAADPRYVETLPRRGYRFVAPLLEAKTPRPAGFRLLHAGMSYPLSPGPNLIGRDPASTLCLDASSVSRRHAEILVSEEGAVVRDLGSKNGTFHGNARVRDSSVLADGDEIRIGTVRVLFHGSAGDSTASVSTDLPADDVS